MFIDSGLDRYAAELAPSSIAEKIRQLLSARPKMDHLGLSAPASERAAWLWEAATLMREIEDEDDSGRAHEIADIARERCFRIIEERVRDL